MLGLLIFFFLSAAQACLITRVSRSDGYFSQKAFMLRNFDFPIGGRDGYGRLFINPRGYQRVSFPRYKVDRPMNWTAKYASLTFNLVAENFPQDGINEKGLTMQSTVILNQYHSDNFTNTDLSLPTLNEMDLIQYVLDQAATVDEAMNLFFESRSNKPKIRLSMLTHVHIEKLGQILNYHWGICDASGKCALLEFVKGSFQKRVYSSNDLFIVTNNDESAMCSEYSRLDQGNLPIDQALVKRETFSRYANARFYQENPRKIVQEYNEYRNEYRRARHNQTTSCEIKYDEIYRYFYQLDRSTMQSWNKWQTVFDMKDRRVYFRTRANLDLNWVDFGKFNLTNFSHPLGMSFHLEGGQINQTEFVQVDLSTVESEIKTISTLMKNPVEWSHVISAYLWNMRETNRDRIENNLINRDETFIEWCPRSFEDQVPNPTYPDKISYTWAEIKVGWHIFWHGVKRNFWELKDLIIGDLY